MCWGQLTESSSGILLAALIHVLFNVLTLLFTSPLSRYMDGLVAVCKRTDLVAMTIVKCVVQFAGTRSLVA